MTDIAEGVPKKRMLVVDDSKTAAQILANMVEDLGYQAEMVLDAESALELYRSKHFDAVLTDLCLPGMAGLELLKELKTIDNDAIIVLVTEHEEIDVADECERYDLVYYLRKPANIFELGTILKNALENQLLRRDIDALRSLAVSLKSIGNIKDMDEEYKVVLNLAIDSLSGDIGSLFLSGDDGSLNVRAAFDSKGTSLEEDEDTPRLAAELVMKTQEATVLKEPTDEIPFRKTTNSILAAPLIIERKLDGVLVLERSKAHPAFSEKDLVIAKIFATTIALAEENFKLFRDSKKTYGELLDAQKQLIRLEKLASLGHLTAGIAHEIKNPLTVVTGLLGLTRRKLEDEAIVRDIEMCLRNCERINKIIKNLRNLYTPSRASYQPVNLNAVLEEALSLTALRSDFRAIALEKDLLTEEPHVSGDESQILQVFINLLNNAIQAMPKGGRLIVQTLSEDDTALVFVRDTGVGIPDENLSRLFDPFFTTHQAGEGTGLGLTISSTIVANHGGVIEVSSEPGEGTIFTLRFPLLTESSDDKSDEHHGPRVLVLDDEKDILYWVESLLGDSGMDVTTESVPAKAVEILEKNEFDVMLIDAKMPTQDGISLFRDVIAKRYPTMKVVLFTGSESIEDETLKRLGFFGLIEKPCNGDRLLEVIRRATAD